MRPLLGSAARLLAAPGGDDARRESSSRPLVRIVPTARPVSSSWPTSKDGPSPTRDTGCGPIRTNRSATRSCGRPKSNWTGRTPLEIVDVFTRDLVARHVDPPRPTDPTTDDAWLDLVHHTYYPRSRTTDAHPTRKTATDHARPPVDAPQPPLPSEAATLGVHDLIAHSGWVRRRGSPGLCGLKSPTHQAKPCAPNRQGPASQPSRSHSTQPTWPHAGRPGASSSFSTSGPRGPRSPFAHLAHQS